jgi:SAM-dependent methyltransferase
MLIFYTKSLPASDPAFWPDFWKVNAAVVREAFMPDFQAFQQHVSPGAKVLDAGCGPGHLTREMIRKGYRAVGVDFDQLSIQWGVREYGSFPGAIANVTQLPYRSNIFDAVFLSGVAEHVPTGAGTAIQECARTLRPGGRLVVTLPYQNVVRKLYAPFYRIRTKLEREPRHFDQFVYNRAEIAALLQASGLRILNYRRTHYITVLLRIPGISSLHRAIFPPRPITAATPGESKPLARGAPAGRLKPMAKTVVEGILNLLIANRLTVVAEKMG